MNIKYKKIIFPVITILLLTFLGIYKFLLPNFIETENITQIILNSVNDGYKISMDELDTSLSWDFAFEAKMKKFNLSKDTKKLLNVTDVKIKVPLIFLLFKKIDYAKIYANDIQAVIKRDNDGFINIQKAFKVNSSKQNISGLKLYAQRYNIAYQDYNTPKVLLKGKNLALEDAKNFKLRFNGDAIWDDGYKTNIDLKFKARKPFNISNLKIQSHINNFDLKRIEPYILSFTPKIKNISGKLDGYIYFDTYTNKVIGNNFNINLKSNNLNIATNKFQNYITILNKSEIQSQGKYSDKRVIFEELKLNSPDYNIFLKGNIKDLNKKNKDLNLQLKVENSLLSKLSALIPKDLNIKNDALNKGIKHKVNGYINCDLKITGKHTLPEYYGTIDIKNLAFNEDLSSSKSSGTITFDKRTLDINFDILDKNAKKLTIIGQSKILIDRFVDLKINAYNYDLSNAHSKILIFGDILNFKVGALSKMKLTGKINSKLKIRGPTKLANTNGYIDVIEAKIQHSDFDGYIKAINQNLKFNNREIIFKDFKSIKDGSEVITNGCIDFEDKIDINLKIKKSNLAYGLKFLKNSKQLQKTAEKLEFIESLGGYAGINVNIKGNKNDLKTNGKIHLQESQLYLKGFHIPYSSVTGNIYFDDKDCIFKNLAIKMLNSNISLTGNVKDNHTNIQLASDTFDLGSIWTLIKKSKNLQQIYSKLSKIENIEGKSAAILNLSGAIKDTNIFDFIEANIKNAIIKLKNLPTPIYVNDGKFRANKTNFIANNLIIKTIGTKGIVDGSIREINGKDKYDITINFQNLDKNSLNSIKAFNICPGFSNLGKFSGTASGFVKIQDKLSGRVIFNKLSAHYLPLDVPMSIRSGELLIQNNNFNLRNIDLNVGKSNFMLQGDFDKHLLGNLDINGTLLAEDSDKYLNKLFKYPFNIKKSTPIRLYMTKKSPNSTNIAAGIFLDKNNIISYRGASFGDKTSINLIGGQLQKIGNQYNLNNFGMKKYNSDISPQKAFSEIIDDKNVFKLSGNIHSDLSKGKLKFVSKEFLDINILNSILDIQNTSKMFDKGQFKANLVLDGDFKMPKILGSLNIKDTIIPSAKAKINNMNLQFDKHSISVKNTDLELADSKFNIEAVIENILEKPFVVKSLKINSPYINIDEMLNMTKNHKTQTRGTLPFFVIKKGVLKSEKLIINNLINKNAIINFTFTPDWITTLDSFDFDTAGGKVSGSGKIDTTTSCIDTYLRFKNIKANAAATTLLQLPNEIYGVLSGEAKFSTKGISKKELVKNANGEVNFQINSGRLVRLGSLEYLLRAAEVIKSGVTGLCINNVVTLLNPKNTGHFDTINLDGSVKDGVFYTDNLISRGKNLSLYIAGSIDMSTNYSDITILGRVSKAVTGFLGPVGNFSISKVVHSIPGMGGSDNTLASIMPNLSKIPGIDFNDEQYRRFVVNIEGDLYNSKSVRKFRWVD